MTRTCPDKPPAPVIVAFPSRDPFGGLFKTGRTTEALG